MGGFNLNIDDIKNYEEKLIPAGKYLVEVLSGKDGTTLKERGKMDLRVKILDSIPGGEDFDLEAFLDPIDSQLFISIYLPMEGDKPNTINMMTKGLSNFLKFFDVEASEKGVLTAEDFVGCSGGVVVKHERAFKDDPDSDMRATIKGACAQ